MPWLWRWNYTPNPLRDAAYKALHTAERKGLLTRKEIRVWGEKIRIGKYNWRPACLR